MPREVMDGGAQGQAGCSSGQSDLGDDVPAHSQGPLPDLQGVHSMQTTL